MRLCGDASDVHAILDAVDSLKRHRDNAMVIDCLKHELDHKRNLLVKLRGAARMRRNKWTTLIPHTPATATTDHPRRTASKMNKLLPDEDVLRSPSRESQTQSRAEGKVKEPTFKAQLHARLAQEGFTCEMVQALDEWMFANNFDTDAIAQDI